MRMDRYEDDEDKVMPTRTNKNQELYTDVYLNNAYVDISDLKEVMDEPNEEKELLKNSKHNTISYTYEDKNYDIVAIIEEKIKNNEDKVKRNFENDEEVENIIESINEIQREKEANDTLLSDLMPDRDTEVIPPLENPILDTSIMDTSALHKDEMSDELANIDETKEEKIIKEEKIEDDKELDDSFAMETKFPKKIIFIIVGVIVLIGIILGILIWKKVIKF